ncbi:hypothetical protein ciss_10870 [Carboxydothermus islandicus]|uniref:Polymerase nucleotidyl transferase domain-containing protein n=1 Tax=Carboxydothermus islandicus TaxID=661089 RepID=A0A1L8D211_9THEO|nr:nucleotidyltransferase domain-containing protein [Carboxydothermus islandicus]GAV25154.1 hypothetical protein ciss_10870 [Carboxydothermus islandicus]
MKNLLKNEELKKIYHNLVSNLLTIFQDNLKEVILFGSYARGEESEDSDIDIIAIVDLSPEKLKDYREEILKIQLDILNQWDLVVSILLQSCLWQNKSAEFGKVKVQS